MRLPNKLPWRRKSGQISSLPPEVEQYYSGNKNQRRSVAWALAFATLVITVIIAFGAFFVGRLVYRKIAGSGTKPTTVITQPAEPGNAESEPAKSAKKKTTTPNTPSTPTDLADTGPGEILAVFIITSVIGTGFYEYKLRRKTN